MFAPLSVSAEGRDAAWQEGGEGETKPTLLGPVVVRLFLGWLEELRDQAAHEGMQDLLGSLLHRQQAGLRQSQAEE